MWFMCRGTRLVRLLVRATRFGAEDSLTNLPLRAIFDVERLEKCRVNLVKIARSENLCVIVENVLSPVQLINISRHCSDLYIWDIARTSLCTLSTRDVRSGTGCRVMLCDMQLISMKQQTFSRSTHLWC